MYGALRGHLCDSTVFLFLFVRHATMLGTESLHGIIRIRIALGGNGHKPPGQDSFSFRSTFRFRSRYSSSYTTSGEAKWGFFGPSSVKRGRTHITIG